MGFDHFAEFVQMRDKFIEIDIASIGNETVIAINGEVVAKVPGYYDFERGAIVYGDFIMSYSGDGKFKIIKGGEVIDDNVSAEDLEIYVGLYCD